MIAAASACTSFLLTAKDGSTAYARTMEFGVDMKAQVTMLPRGLAMAGTLPNMQPGKQWTSRYAALGMNGFNLPIIVDGFDEKGLAGGMPVFPGSTKFVPAAEAPKAKALASWEFLAWALTNHASVAEVKQAIAAGEVVLTDTVQADQGIAPPLHYTLHDRSGASVVIEPIDGKLLVTDNPYTVMTNSPDFGWQTTNLRNAEHILNHLDLPNGSAGEYSGIEGQGSFELTYWSAIADMSSQRFCFKTYDNQPLRYVDLKDFDLSAKAPRYLPTTQPYAPQRLQP